MMVTITLDKISQKPLLKNLHFNDLPAFFVFLKENDYITETGIVEDNDLLPEHLYQINKNISLDKSLFVDITKA